ncbi:MAG: hypothetical protein LBK94_04770 [Prevotellaceae bacterium]|jgi:hypothetical protein|nr:hypothetical protein [Prevotellaceae bacterium]
MKKIIHTLKFAAILLLLAGMMVACGKDKENEPIEIPFTEYSLIDTYCHWNSFGPFDSVTVINSNAEMEKYVTCMEGSFPEIDFTKNTLLLARGGTTTNVDYINIVLLKCSKTEYELKITVFVGIATVAQGWSIKIVVPKLSENVQINLNAQLMDIF